MIKNSIILEILQIEGVKRQDNLSCHMLINEKLYDVIFPLSLKNKDNKVIIPIESIINLRIHTLDGDPEPLYYSSFNSSLLTESLLFLPLFAVPTEIQNFNSFIKSPKLSIKIYFNSENLQTNDSENLENSENTQKNTKIEEITIFYENELRKKTEEILRLRQEIENLKDDSHHKGFLEITNKDIDITELYLKVYLQKNELEGLFKKHKGSLYKYGNNFVEIMVKENKIVCRIDFEWSSIEDFISEFCVQEILKLKTIVSRKKNVSQDFVKIVNQKPSKRSPIRSNRHVEPLENFDNFVELQKKESFQKLLKPTISTSSKTQRYTIRNALKSPFR